MARPALRRPLPVASRSRRALLRAGLAAIGVAALAPAGRGLAWDAAGMLVAARLHGARALDAAVELKRLMESLSGRDEVEQVRSINEHFNRRIAFADDTTVWGQRDHWASPLELLSRGAGDCEDYAIAKYFALVGLGVPVARLRLVYVRAMIGGPQGVSQAHMVLAYYATPDAEPLVLDNLLADVRPASRRPDLAPVFSFNTEGLWEGTGPQSNGDPVQRLSRWREVIAKARSEGFR